MKYLADFAVVAGLLTLGGSLVRQARRRERSMPDYAAMREPDRDDIRTWPGVGPLVPVVHQTPDHDAAQICQRCGTPLASLPAGDAVSHERRRVTCR